MQIKVGFCGAQIKIRAKRRRGRGAGDLFFGKGRGVAFWRCFFLGHLSLVSRLSVGWRGMREGREQCPFAMLRLPLEPWNEAGRGEKYEKVAGLLHMLFIFRTFARRTITALDI